MNMQVTGRVCAKLKDDPNKESACMLTPQSSYSRVLKAK